MAKLSILLLIIILSITMTATSSLATGTTEVSSPPIKKFKAATKQDEITIQLAKKERAHHFHGMVELQSMIETKPLQVKAFAIDDKDSPSINSDSSDDEIVKIVHFVRHGQGFHNLLADIYSAQGKEWTQFKQEENNPYVRTELLDAPLTDKGRKQAQALQSQTESFGTQSESNSGESEIDVLQLVVLSTNCRALQTGVIAFQSYVDKVPFIAHEMAREEIGVHLCDQRRQISSHKIDFPMVNFDLIESDEDVLFTHDKRESKVEIGERIYSFLEWLETRTERHIGVTSHSGWLSTMFNGVIDCDEKLKGWFHTGEMRSVKLVFTRNKPSTCQ